MKKGCDRVRRVRRVQNGPGGLRREGEQSLVFGSIWVRSGHEPQLRSSRDQKPNESNDSVVGDCRKGASRMTDKQKWTSGGENESRSIGAQRRMKIEQSKTHLG